MRFLFILLCSVWGLTSNATITLNNIIVTASTCPNNGTATIFASSNQSGAALYYALGPGYTVWQNDSTFRSLASGNYTARVYDINSFDSLQVNFTIAGNYRVPAYYPTVTPALCNPLGGSIKGNADSLSGKLPFTWEIVSPQPRGPRSSDVFDSLPSGYYTLRLTDACANFQTRSFDLNNAQVVLVSNYPRIGADINGCSSDIRADITLNSTYSSLPLTLKITSKVGISIATMQAHPSSAGFNDFYLEQNLNISYGDTFNLCVTDFCGKTICGSYQIPPFSPRISFLNVVNACTPLAQLTLPSTIDSLKIIDSITGNLIYDGLYRPNVTNYLVPGHAYYIRVTDGCGHSSQQTITATTLNSSMPGCTYFSDCSSLIDSTASYSFRQLNFSNPINFTFLSGPAVASSTTPHFSYYHTLTYPITFNIPYQYFNIEGMPAGKYIYRISDTCGNVLTDSLIVTKVAGKNFSQYYKRTCNQINNLYISLFDRNNTCLYSNAYIKVNNLNNGATLLYNNSNSFSLQNVPAGTYVTTYSKSGSGFSLVPISSVYFKDTIVIPQQTNQLIKSITTILCHGAIYVDVVSNQNNGPTPFKYQIISGPQTFPFQNGSLFQLRQTGTYVARVVDSCNNSNVVQVTVDTAKLDTVFRGGNLCANNMVKLWSVSSPYISYKWQQPNGNVYYGDTLTIPWFSMNDTGYYQIQKVVYINGCRDTFYFRYYVGDKNIYYQDASVCSGTTYNIGNHQYSLPGIYTDTLISQTACDSIVVTNLSVLPLPTALITPHQNTACYPADTVFNFTASGGSYYSWNSGQTTSVIATSKFQPSYTYVVTVTNYVGCTDTDTAEMLVLRPQLSLPSPFAVCNNQNNILCPSDTSLMSYQWSTGDTSSCIIPRTAGSYRVQAVDNYGCTATSNLSVANFYSPRVTITVAPSTICPNGLSEICTRGNWTDYYWNSGERSDCIYTSSAGNYYVTVTDANNCTVESNHVAVTVLQPPPVTITVNGDTLTAYNAQIYQWILNGVNITSANYPTFIPTVSGNYQVRVTDANGCTSTSLPVVVTITGVPFIDGEYGVNVYPNPTNANCTISFKTDDDYPVFLKLSNALGVVIKDEYCGVVSGVFKKQLDLNQFPKGVYLLKLSIGQHEINKRIELF